MKNAEHIISTRATLNKCRRSSSVRANLHPSCALPPSLFTPLLTFISPFLFSFLIFPPFLSFNSLFPQVFISFKYFPIPVILFGRLSGHPFLSLCRLESLPQGLLTWDLWMPFRDLKNTDTTQHVMRGRLHSPSPGFGGFHAFSKVKNHWSVGCNYPPSQMTCCISSPVASLVWGGLFRLGKTSPLCSLDAESMRDLSHSIRKALNSQAIPQLLQYCVVLYYLCNSFVLQNVSGFRETTLCIPYGQLHFNQSRYFSL